MINKEIREKYPSIGFDQLENYMLSYQERYYTLSCASKKKPDRLLGQNGITFLLNSLIRSRYIFTGFIDCLNRAHVLLAFLATRAHFETTGSVAYFFRHLRKFYNGKISYEKVDNILYRLSLGCKTYPPKDTHPERPDPINILTQVDAADKLFAEMGGHNKPFRNSYDFLSEFCHPNFLGLTMGSEIVAKNTVVYSEKLEFKEAHFVKLVNYMLMDCGFFFHIYDECFSLIRKNEQIPKLIK